MAVREQHSHILLPWSEKDKRVVIEDADEDRFSLTVEEAIEACSVYHKEKRAQFRRQFHDLLDFLGKWTYARRTEIFKAFLTIRDAGLLFLVVSRGKKYDPVFEDELTKLDITIANSEEFSEIQMSVQALPFCGAPNYDSFCNPDLTLEYKVRDAN